MANKLPQEVSNLIDSITESDFEIRKANKRLHLGSLCLWYYPAPKYASRLEVFDTIPLVLILGWNSTHVVGINLHFLNWSQRLAFMKHIKSKKGKIKYPDIKKAFNSAQVPVALARYAYRMYLISHIKSNVRVFDIRNDYEDAYKIAQNVLPIFKKKSMSAVYSDISKRFNKHKKSLKKK